MSGIVKVLTGILGVVAVVACLGTIGIIGYSMAGADKKEETEVSGEAQPAPTDILAVPTALPTQAPSPEPEQTPKEEPTPLPLIPVPDLNHVHDYEESIEKNATCYSAGQVKYTCRGCKDTYYVDIASTGHVPDDWEVTRKPTDERDGLRVKKCIYCDEIVAQETVPFEVVTGPGEGENGGGTGADAAHVHQYTASIDREPTCILAGLRRYSCTCGDFYTEMIPAPGHVATDWTEAAAATTTVMGTEQITCSVCGTLLDSRPVPVLTPSPGASPSAQNNPTATPQATSAASGSPQGTATPAPTAAPTASPHAHEFRSYVLQEANCQQAGIRSFVCSSCGRSYAESIPADTNRHSYRSVVVPATKTNQGYTAYTCIRCNHTYNDNYTPALGG